MARPRFTPHPLIEKLTAGPDAVGAVKLLGYIGGSANGAVKVYASLDDLSVYYEVREDDIVHVEDAPPEELPHDGSAIWVKGDAQIERIVNRRTSVEARFLAGGIAARMAGGPAVSYRSLAQQVMPETAGGSGCEESQVWPCSVVIGVCLASNDMPCAYTDAWWCLKNPATIDSCITCAGWTCLGPCYSVACPPTQGRFCTAGRFTQCGCEVASALCPR